MIAVQIILIAIGALLADADECSCRCNKQDVCDEQNALRTKLDNNTDEIQKWNRYYNLVKGLSEDWEYQFEHIMRKQLELEINETVEGLQNASQKIVSKHKEDMMARMESLENSVQALREEADVLDITMEMLSDEMRVLRTEFRRIQSIKNVGKCGVDFDNGGSNGGGNTSSVLVWPWIAALYRNETTGTKHVCGGSVIHRHFVLTSAWCVVLYGRDELSVKLGLADLKKGTHLREYRVQKTHIHPQYRRSPNNNVDYNIGLLEMEEPIQFSPFVRPVCLPPTEIPEGDIMYKPQSAAKAVYVGRYLSSPETASPTVLNLTILPQEECRRKLKEREWEKYFPSPDLSFCAESSNRCPFSGSPVVQSSLDGTRTWTQVGIGMFCSGKYYFSPRLDHLRAWVDATIAASFKV